MKYPVVLVHGLSAIDRKKIFDFWGRIPEFLKAHGIEVFFGNTDAWGGYESNAEILKTTIENVLLKTNKVKANIIAHSKGGIDSRYLIWKHDFGGKIASLTMIGTPHHGSELADLVVKQKPVHSVMVRRALKVFGKLLGDKNPDPYNTVKYLTTAHMKEFNEKVKMDKRVYCQNFYTTMNHAFDDFTLFFSYLYIKKTSGRNDGVVSEASARWGENCEQIKGKRGGISHIEIIDIKKKKIAGTDILMLYLDMLNDLSKKGF